MIECLPPAGGEAAEEAIWNPKGWLPSGLVFAASLWHLFLLHFWARCHRPLAERSFGDSTLWLQFHRYQVVGRGLPTATDDHPKIYRMKLSATDEVRAKSKFCWSFDIACQVSCSLMLASRVLSLFTSILVILSFWHDLWCQCFSNAEVWPKTH